MASNICQAVLEGSGDIKDMQGRIAVGPGAGCLSVSASADGGDGDASGRVRLEGRLIVRGGGASLRAAAVTSSEMFDDFAAAPIVTLQSPLFLQGPCTLEPAGAVRDDDWVDEGVYRCKLVRTSWGEAEAGAQEQEVWVVVRGVSPGDHVSIRLTVDAGARMELQGGSLSLQGAALTWQRTELDGTQTASMADGYAVRAADCPGTLVVAASGELSPGEAAYIAAGGAVPGGADAVVPAAGCDELQCPWGWGHLQRNPIQTKTKMHPLHVGSCLPLDQSHQGTSLGHFAPTPLSTLGVSSPDAAARCAWPYRRARRVRPRGGGASPHNLTT